MLVSEEGGVPVRVEELPPMPAPDLTQMRSQATTGTVVVLSLIALLAGSPHLRAVGCPSQVPGLGCNVGFALLYIESILALVCLCGLMWADPGTLKRSQERCFPLPQSVLDRLRLQQPLAGLENVYEGGNVYCVRCCIWRPDGTKAHHCSICERCVLDFDHHCGVFGRCIAGRGWRGNMGFYKGILVCALAGLLTSLSS